MTALIRQKIIDTALYIQQCGLVRGTSGNISVRLKDTFLITPSGMAYSALTPEDIVELDFAGSVVSGARKPSIEKDLHRLIYKNRNDVAAVVHVHSIYATAIAAARKTLPVVTDNMAAFFGKEIACADYARSGSTELAQNAVKALDCDFGVLLANHGALCVGENIDKALSRCELLEESAKTFILSQFLGGAVCLTEEETQRQFVAVLQNYGQTEGKK